MSRGGAQEEGSGSLGARRKRDGGRLSLVGSQGGGPDHGVEALQPVCLDHLGDLGAGAT